MKQLVSLFPRDTVSTALQKRFSGATQKAVQAIVQVAESSFASRPAGSADRVNLSCRQLYAYTMRHYLDRGAYSKATPSNKFVRSRAEKALVPSQGNTFYKGRRY